jgi:ABC-type multidrug transport system ATPase subunit
MALLLRQVWTLTRKNLIITLWRHWLSTPLRALLLPVLIVVFLSATKNFITADAEYGIGESRPIRALDQVLRSATGGRNRVAFVNNGLKGGQIDSVINAVAQPLKNSGVDVVYPNSDAELRTYCPTNVGGTSICIAAAVFISSPTEGGQNAWNWTLRADGGLGKDTHIGSPDNDAQIYTIPLQHNIDWEIRRQNTTDLNQDALNDIPVHEYPYTDKTEEQYQVDLRKSYTSMIKDALAGPFYLGVATILYQMTGFIATEREIGMAKLLDTMMPNRKRWQTQVARLIAHHISFSLVYGPGWLIAGAIMGAMSFDQTTIIVPILFNLFAGASTSSLSIFFAGFFQKAQLSGIAAMVISLLLAIGGLLAAKSGTAVVAVLALIFPPMNYVFYVVENAQWQSEGLPLNLLKSAPNGRFSLPAIVFFAFAVLHTIIFLILGAFVERWFYGTKSAGRTTIVSESPIAVNIKGFTKEYKPSFLDKATQLLTKSPMDPVLAVDNLTLQAYRGEILVLLGANGSGKSTTLDAVAGLHDITSGQIELSYPDAQGSFGYCPQKNILWDDLTVEEHVKIFERIKSVGKPADKKTRRALIESCDLSKKKGGLSKSLSGGQKRKLQMAMMFAGGSTVCCVDEVSSGVDPLSRRKLWDILLSERGRRSIILTTHFLDEADLLADRISILSKGILKAAGTSVELKDRLGSGYRVSIHYVPGKARPPVYTNVLHEEHDHGVVYFSGTSADTYRFLRQLDHDGINDYQVNGPTLEDAFFKVEEDVDPTATATRGDRASYESGSPLVNSNTHPEKQAGMLNELQSGKIIGIPRQIKVLMSKRFLIFRRNFMPYILALAIPIIAAGCATLFLKSYAPGSCDPAQQVGDSGETLDTSSLRVILGPNASLGDATREQLAKFQPDQYRVVESLDEFNRVLAENVTNYKFGYWLGNNDPTFAYQTNGVGPLTSFYVQNLFDNEWLNMTIGSQYDPLDLPFIGSIAGPLLFVILFGLAMAVYPAFLGLYPTLEKLRGIRAMHYSNGVRTLPLWLAYLLFDFLFIITISAVVVIIFAATLDFWFAIEYVFLICLLYGITATLYAYVIAIFSKSQLAGFAITAATQSVMLVAFFLVFMVVFTNTESADQQSTLNIAYFTMGAISPVVSLARSLYLTLNIFGVSCRDKKLGYAGAIDLYGGPILYLIVQAFILFGIIIWNESATGFRLWARKSKASRDVMELEAPSDYVRETKASDGLRVMDLRKEFGKFTAVDDITFGVPTSECFALVGPNGAGKSTTISMIRGDIQPTGRNGEIIIDGVSLMHNRANARARLGVCPQIDPLDAMTVVEHLEFYAQIRGIKDPAHNIQAIMKAVGLEPFAQRLGTNLSGGNKRKLSLGIALMGNPSVLLLDEPSSGMDALSKRKMWKTLSSVTPGRSLLLTTHSMEEADALCSRAGIIAGRMLALGSTEQLRAQFGNAYYVHLVHSQAPHTHPREMERINRWVQRQFPDARTEERSYYGQVKFEVPLQSRDGVQNSLANIFGALERAKEQLDVQYYSVCTATLDQIFLEVVGRHQITEEGQ